MFLVFLASILVYRIDGHPPAKDAFIKLTSWQLLETVHEVDLMDPSLKMPRCLLLFVQRRMFRFVCDGYVQ